ncbi:MAG: universal stress protein [Nevskiales bacterium]|nr:universal stress protein [Nevskiales bacterium]
MQRLERILIAIDCRGALDTPALRCGVELARRSGARLDLVLFDHHPLIDATADLVPPTQMMASKSDYLDRHRNWLADRIEILSGEGLQIAGEIRWTPALHEALIDRVLEYRPDLVIRDVGHNPASGNLHLSSADWKTLRLCPAPLLIMPPNMPVLPERIIAAVDTAKGGGAKGGTPLNDLIAEQALRLGLYADAEVGLAHVFPYEPLGDRIGQRLQDAYDDMRAIDRQNFDDYAQRLRIPEQKCHLLSGPPGNALAHLAERGLVDLLVIGTVYRNSLERFFLGSTAEYLLGLMPCSLLVIKPSDFKTELQRHIDLEALRRRQSLLQTERVYAVGESEFESQKVA